MAAGIWIKNAHRICCCCTVAPGGRDGDSLRTGRYGLRIPLRIPSRRTSRPTEPSVKWISVLFLAAVSLTTQLFPSPGSIVVRTRADEPMARVQDFLGTRHSLLSQFFYFFCATGFSIVKNMCIQSIYTNLTEQRLYMNYHCFKIILRVKHFYTNWELCEVLPG